MPPLRGHTEAEERLGLVDREESQELVAQIANLDVFFEQVYGYYQASGYLCFIVEGVLRILRALFVIAFTSFLVLFVDWKAVMGCRNEQCETVRMTRQSPLRGMTWWHLCGLGLEASFLSHLGVLTLRFLGNVRSGVTVRKVYHLMDIDDNQIPALSWGEVADRLVRLQSRVLLSRLGPVDQLNIAMRLMRVDNYMVALFSLDVLDLSLFGVPIHLTRSLEWNLRYLVNFAVTSLEVRRTRPGLPWGAAFLQSKIRWLGMINLLAAPFVFCYLAIVATFAHGAEIKMSPGKVSVRQWTREALWRLREYNELPHLFGRRLQLASPLAQAYIDHFPYRIISVLARFILFTAGGFAFAILLFSFLNYPLLLFVEIQGQNLLWWLSVLTLVIVASLKFSEDDPAAFSDPGAALDALVAQTRYRPAHWTDPRQSTVRDAVAELYQYRWSIAFQEAMSIILTPVALLLVLPGQAARLCKFIEDFTVVVDAAGPFCVLSTFAPGGVVLPSEQQDKLLCSFRSFCAANPSWDPGDRAALLHDDVEMVTLRDIPP